jgi:hypothetical protein
LRYSGIWVVDKLGIWCHKRAHGRNRPEVLWGEGVWQYLDTIRAVIHSHFLE